MAKGGKQPGAGRPKGSLAPSTLKAKVLRDKLIQAYEVVAETINIKLMEKAIAGDIMAIKEIHERVYGKAYQQGELDITSNGAPVVQLSDEQYKQALAAAAKRSNSNQSGT